MRSLIFQYLSSFNLSYRKPPLNPLHCFSSVLMTLQTIVSSVAPPAAVGSGFRSRRQNALGFSGDGSTSASTKLSSFLPLQKSKEIAVPRRKAMALILSGFIYLQTGTCDKAFALQSVGFKEYIDQFDGYTLVYPSNWIQVRGAGADIFFRDPFVLDENISVNISSPSSSNFKSVEDLGSPEEAGKKVMRQYLTEFMSTRLGVRRESRILSTSSKVAGDGKLYYVVEVNIKSYANNNELAVMPEERVVRLEWDRRYLSVLGVENNRLYELRLQSPEKSFAEEENDLRKIMDAFRVNAIAA